MGGSAVSWERVNEDKARDFYVERANFRASFLLDRREADRHAPRRGHRSHARGRGGRPAPAPSSSDKRKHADEPPQVEAKRSKTDE